MDVVEMNKKGQMGSNAIVIAVGIILMVILVIGVAYKFLKTVASPTALGINSDDPEYYLVLYLPLIVILVVFIGFLGYIYVKNK